MTEPAPMHLTIEELHIAATSDATMQEFESLGTCLAQWQRGVNWWIGDLARYAARRWPDTWAQVFPECLSPDHIARCKAVAEAYKPVERNPLATWSIHMRLANKPDRVARVQQHVDAGHTSDEARDAEKGTLSPSEKARASRWLLAVDVNYYIHRFFHSGAGVEAAASVAEWLERLVDRLKIKGLTDLVCCFDSKTNHRKKLTETWEKPYKPRAKKDEEVVGQLEAVRELLEARNYCCVSVEDMEADDLMCSCAAQFPGRVTLLTQDKDARQCLSENCNILLDIKWNEDPTSGQAIPDYKWVTCSSHFNEGCTYNATNISGITPEKWVEFQAIAGDSSDGIAGVVGIGAKGAMDLIQKFGTLEALIEAVRNGDSGLTEKKQAAVLEFAEKHAEVTLALVTMRKDLEVPKTTKLG